MRLTSSRRADRVLVGRGLHDRPYCRHRRQLAVGIGLAVARPFHVPDLLVRLAVGVDPALDDLHAIEVGTVGILHRRDQEGRRLAAAARPSGRRPSARPWRSRSRRGRCHVARREVEAAEEAHASCAARWSRRSPCASSRPTRLRACSRWPTRPCSRRPPGPSRARRWPADHDRLPARCRGFERLELAPEVVLLRRGQAGVRVGRAVRAVLERIRAERRFAGASPTSAPRASTRSGPCRACLGSTDQVAARPTRSQFANSSVGDRRRVAFALPLELGRVRTSGSQRARVSAYSRVSGPPVESLLLEHAAVGQIAVVRNRQHLAAGLGLVVAPSRPRACSGSWVWKVVSGSIALALSAPSR